MRSIILFCTTFFFMLLICGTKVYAGKYDSDVMFVSNQYIDVREIGNKNTSPDIDRWIGNVGLDNKISLRTTGTGYSWCAAYVCSMFIETYNYHAEKSPFARNARVVNLWKQAKKDKYTYKTFTAKQVYLGIETLHEADAAVWSHKKNNENNWDGHIGLVISQIDNNTFKSIEGNTVGVATGGQREQGRGSKNVGGVYIKKRTLGIGTYEFPVEGFIRLQDEL